MSKSEETKMSEKIKGVAKEAAGKATGNEERVREGEAQQKRAQKADEAERHEAEAEHKRQQQAGHEGEQRKHED